MNSEIRKVFLCGICGTGMASLAGMLHGRGFAVSGSDAAVYPPMSTFLERMGIPVYEGFSEDNIREAAPDLVVIGNALSRGNPEVEFVLDEGLRYASMPEVLKEFFIRGRRSIVVTGTHGKTTTTAMLGWILTSAGHDPTCLAGGIVENFSGSFRLGEGLECVIEGDEYDTAFFDKGPKFLHYLPRIVLINNLEFDHADIYRDLEAVQTSFRRLINVVPRAGLIVAGAESPAVAEVLRDARARVIRFGVESGECRAGAIRPEAIGTSFAAVIDGRFWYRFRIPMIGEFNVRNALGAALAAREVGVSAEEIQAAFSSFKSVKRRLEVRGEIGGITVYDDFAHHPTAVRETLRAVRAQYPDSAIWAVFEPRSQTSRRRVFEEEYAEALALADRVSIAPLYSGKLSGRDSETLSPERVAAAIRAGGGKAEACAGTADIVQRIGEAAVTGDRIVVMSNGGFDRIHERIMDVLARRSGGLRQEESAG